MLCEGRKKEKKRKRRAGRAGSLGAKSGCKVHAFYDFHEISQRMYGEWVWILFINLSRLNTQFGQLGTGVLCGGIHELHFPVIVSHP